MLLLALLVIPAVAGVAAFVPQPLWERRALLIGTAVAHAVLVGLVWLLADRPLAGASGLGLAVLAAGWLELDTLGLYFLSIVSVLFLASSCYALGYLQMESEHAEHRDLNAGYLFTNEPEAVFIGCLLLFLFSMTLVTMSQHFGLLWVAVEATTLASAPLIYFHKQNRSLEATWKYLLICSVGIALALLGNFSLAASVPHTPAGPTQHEAAPSFEIALTLPDLVANGPKLKTLALKVAFLFFLVGYGTKMGLAPMHTWLPDAHSESPSLVSALLSGALLNCAFLGILRCQQVCLAAGPEMEGFTRELLLAFGLLSMTVAAIFIIGQTDFKRMLAYSSVEHMGILSLGIGLGGAGIFGSMLHAVNHSLTKASLFLVAGNILAAYHTKDVRKIGRLRAVLPLSSVLWVLGFLAITGTPPFGVFLSEFTILRAALDQNRPWVAGAYLVLLALIFIGMATIVMKMVHGGSIPARSASEGDLLPSLALRAGMEPPQLEAMWQIAPSALLCLAVLILGLYLPEQLNETLKQVAHTLGMK